MARPRLADPRHRDPSVGSRADASLTDTRRLPLPPCGLRHGQSPDSPAADNDLPSERPEPRERLTMREMTLYVGGMGCRRCVREVTARLRDVSGVQTVVADSATSTLRLGGSMAVEDVLDAFTGTTYRPNFV
jgi:copper chaperone CopZ